MLIWTFVPRSDLKDLLVLSAEPIRMQRVIHTRLQCSNCIYLVLRKKAILSGSDYAQISGREPPFILSVEVPDRDEAAFVK